MPRVEPVGRDTLPESLRAQWGSVCVCAPFEGMPGAFALEAPGADGGAWTRVRGGTPLSRGRGGRSPCGRGGRIRTGDPLLPKQMRCQTAPRPDARLSSPDRAPPPAPGASQATGVRAPKPPSSA